MSIMAPKGIGVVQMHSDALVECGGKQSVLGYIYIYLFIMKGAKPHFYTITRHIDPSPQNAQF